MATVIARATCTMLVALVAPACVSRSALPPAPSPADFERLETVVAADPGDLEAGLSLAAGYREAGRIEEGRSLVGDLAETPRTT